MPHEGVEGTAAQRDALLPGLRCFHFPVAGVTWRVLLQLRCRKYYNYINFAEGIKRIKRVERTEVACEHEYV